MKHKSAMNHYDDFIKTSPRPFQAESSTDRAIPKLNHPSNRTSLDKNFIFTENIWRKNNKMY